MIDNPILLTSYLTAETILHRLELLIIFTFAHHIELLYKNLYIIIIDYPNPCISQWLIETSWNHTNGMNSQLIGETILSILTANNRWRAVVHVHCMSEIIQMISTLYRWYITNRNYINDIINININYFFQRCIELLDMHRKCIEGMRFTGQRYVG